MYCPNCGKEILENTAFCAYCGAQVKAQQPAPEQPQYQQPVQQGYYQPQYQQPVQPNFYQQTMVDENESDATISFVCGILSFFFGLIPIILAFVFGNRYLDGTGYRKPENEKRALTGKKLAKIALIIQIVVIVLYVLFAIVLAAGVSYM